MTTYKLTLQEQMKTLLDTALEEYSSYNFEREVEQIIKNTIKSKIVTAEMLQKIIIHPKGYDKFNDKVYKRLNKIIKKNTELLKNFVESDFSKGHEIITEIYFNKNTPDEYKQILAKNPIIKKIEKENEMEDIEMYENNAQSFSTDAMCSVKEIQDIM